MLSLLPRASRAHRELGANAPGEGEQLRGSFSPPQAPPGRGEGSLAAGGELLQQQFRHCQQPSSPQRPLPKPKMLLKQQWARVVGRRVLGGSRWSETPCVGQGHPDAVPIVGLQGLILHQALLGLQGGFFLFIFFLISFCC